MNRTKDGMLLAKFVLGAMQRTPEERSSYFIAAADLVNLFAELVHSPDIGLYGGANSFG